MTKKCVICQELIIEKKEKWVRLTDFDRKQQTNEVFYHLECWKDRFKVSNSLRKQKMYAQAQEAIKKIGNVFNSLPINKSKVYQTIPT